MWIILSDQFSFKYIMGYQILQNLLSSKKNWVFRIFFAISNVKFKISFLKINAQSLLLTCRERHQYKLISVKLLVKYMWIMCNWQNLVIRCGKSVMFLLGFMVPITLQTFLVCECCVCIWLYLIITQELLFCY